MRQRLVLVDDNADVRELLRVVLSDPNSPFEVVAEACDGLEAIEVARAHQPDFVLLDLAMPRMDGVEALPRIRKVAPDAKVVIHSAFKKERLWSRVEASGAVAYLEKGISPDELISELTTLAGVLESVDSLSKAVVQLGAEARSARDARRFVDQALEQWRISDEVGSLQLLVSEVVTNAVMHAGTEVEVAVHLVGKNVRVEVMDGDPTLPERRTAAAEAQSGRGLAILDQLAARWGAEPNPPGKTVWFELPRSSLVGNGSPTP